MSDLTMLAAVYHGPDDLRVEEYPLPEISRSEVLIKVQSASICGTDLRILHGDHRKYPSGTIRIPGHEVVGTIFAIGDDVKTFSIGQRVFVAPNMGCGHCRQCIAGRNNLCVDYDAIGITIDGAFAEYMRVPAPAILQGNVIALNDQVANATAALTEPLACVVHGQDAVNIQPGDVVLVVGAGPIGVMHIMLARLRGANRIIVSDFISERLAQALEFGADRVVNPNEQDLATVVSDESHGEGADVIIIAAPSPAAQETALQLAAIGGRINFFGGLAKDQSQIAFDSNLVHYKELRVTGTTACNTDDCWRAARLVNSRRIDLSKLISARYPLHDACEAFAVAADRKSLKIVLQP